MVNSGREIVYAASAPFGNPKSICGELPVTSYEPVPEKTTATVRTMILISSHMLQFSI
jgi:hypothetical protein